MNQQAPVLLIILDGFGISALEQGNAVLSAHTPSFDNIIKTYPSTLLHASGPEVGLDFGETGNSEVGHINLGTGRIIMQDLPRIDFSIADGSFFENKELIAAINHVKKNNSILHLVGLTSDGGIHSHINHLFALMDVARRNNVKKLAIHFIADGRDTPPKKAMEFFKKIDNKIKEIGIGKIVSLIGRYYAMDRDKHWTDRTMLFYDLITSAKGEEFENAQSAVESAYKLGESDEEIKPKIIDKKMVINSNDSVIFYNFRTDRIKQIAESIIDPDFNKFNRKKKIDNLFFVSFTNYGFEPSNLVKIAFFEKKIKNSLAEVLSKNNMTQLHIAETEKYAHVTYFFNGGEEKPFSNEERILIPSPRVKSYDFKPEMSAVNITEKFLKYFIAKKPIFTVLNFANPDMVGHSGNFKATVKAIEIVDKCLGIIFNKLLENKVNIIVTADHGNAEQMINPQTGEIDKEHTTNPVPFILISEKKQNSQYDKFSLSTIEPVAVLADVAPTILDLLGIVKPKEMNGQSLRNLI